MLTVNIIMILAEPITSEPLEGNECKAFYDFLFGTIESLFQPT